jgi:hypothetical protein
MPNCANKKIEKKTTKILEWLLIKNFKVGSIRVSSNFLIQMTYGFYYEYYVRGLMYNNCENFDAINNVFCINKLEILYALVFLFFFLIHGLIVYAEKVGWRENLKNKKQFFLYKTPNSTKNKIKKAKNLWVITNHKQAYSEHVIQTPNVSS